MPAAKVGLRSQRARANDLQTLYSVFAGEATPTSPPDVAVPFYRRSGRSSPASAKRRTKALEADLKQLGFRLGNTHTEICCGRYLGRRRTGLIGAIAEAKQPIAKGVNAAVVAPDRARVLRGLNYDGRRKTDTVLPQQWDELRQLAGDVPILVLVDPALPNNEVSARAIRRSGCAGRPRKKVKAPPGSLKARRMKRKAMIVRLIRRAGMGIREASRRFGIPVKTVHDWVK